MFWEVCDTKHIPQKFEKVKEFWETFIKNMIHPKERKGGSHSLGTK